MKPSLVGAIGIITAVAVGGGSITTYAEPPVESKFKAAVISKLPQFVEWPPAAFAGRSTLDLCIVDPDPFGSDLDELVAGDAVGGHPLNVRRVGREQELDGCHLVFLPAGSFAAHRALFQRAASFPILTVGDDERFLDEGGMVQLRLVDGRMRFDINAGAARQAGLRISSQLLQLALKVRGGQS